MKKNINVYKLLLIVTVFLTLGSCQDEFTNRPPEDGISLRCIL